MDRSRWIFVTSLVALLGLTAGCVMQDVYVDEQGNELAVDESGRPIIPGGPSDAAPTAEKPFVPYVVEERIVPDKRPGETAAELTRPAPVQIVPTAPSYSDAASAPKAAPDYDLPPAGTAKPPLETGPAMPGVQVPRTPPVKKKGPAKKKVDSSSNLDLPPAG